LNESSRSVEINLNHHECERPMKKRILAAGVMFLALAATALWLSCQRSSLSTTRQPAVETKQPGASNVTKQSASRISPQTEVKPTSGKLPAAIPDDDEKDDELWRSTREYKAFEDELARFLAAAEARQAQSEHAEAYLTSNEVTFVVTHMQSPHYYARWKAVIAAGGIWNSDPARSTLLPYVVSLLSDPVLRVRRMAADTLGEIGDKSMIPYLEPLLNDRPEVAKLAQRAISTLQQKDTGPKDG
jgi:hypothetical protein